MTGWDLDEEVVGPNNEIGIAIGKEPEIGGIGIQADLIKMRVGIAGCLGLG